MDMIKKIRNIKITLSISPTKPIVLFVKSDNYTTDIDIYHFDRSVSTASDLSKSTYHIKLIEAS